MVKFRSGWIATRARLQLLQDSPTNLCPLCGDHEETVKHILKCPGQAEKRKNFYNSLDQWFRHFQVPLKLHLMVLSQLRYSLGGGPEPASLSSVSSSLCQFCAEQNGIGWFNLFCGFVSSSLAEYMEEHLPDNSNCDGPEWVVRLLRLIQSWVADCWHVRCKHEHSKKR